MLGKLFKRNKFNNSGMALITVIVIIAFIASLASIVLTTTLVNFKMKAVNARSKDSFYSAEQVLDEVNVYLQRVVSDSMGDAYNYVMKNFSQDSSQEKKDLMMLRYYENLWNELEVPGTGHAYYDVNKLEAQLRESTRWNDGAYATNAEGQEYGGILVAVHDDKTEDKNGDMITYTKDGLVLKNLKVYYKDSKGFVSVVQTDIRLGNPDFDFSKSSHVPDIAEYTLIGDTRVTTENLSELSIDGDVYANQLELFAGKNKGNVVINGDNRVVSKYDFSLKNVNLSTGSGVELWTKNIVVDSSSVTYDGDMYVENDMNIKGKNSNVVLSGKYVGYGNGGKDEQPTTVAERSVSGKDISYKSSAIVVNGIESSIDLSKLNQFVLSGRAYVGTSSEDITMGESIAVKSDQMMYLVPASAIGRTTVGSKTESYLNRNPLSDDDLKNLKLMLFNDETVANDKLVDYEVELPELSNNNLNYYMTELKTVNGNVVYDDDGKPERENRTIKVKTYRDQVSGLTYFYMDFSSAQNANLYYSDYYYSNKEKSDKFLDYYADIIKLPKASAFTRTAGFSPYSEIKEGKKTYDIITDEFVEYNKKTIDTYHDYTDIFNSYTKYLVAFREGASDSRASKFEKQDEENLEGTLNYDNENLRLVYNELMLDEFTIGSTRGTDSDINSNMMVKLFEKLKASPTDLKVEDENSDTIYDTRTVTLHTEATNGGKTWEFSTDSDGIVAYISIDKNDSLDTSNSKYQNLGLIVSAGKVTLGRNFAGLLVAKQEVTIKEGVKVLKADKDHVDDIMKFEVGDGDFYIANIFRDGENYSSGDTRKFSLRDYVVYENWKKE